MKLANEWTIKYIWKDLKKNDNYIKNINIKY